MPLPQRSILRRRVFALYADAPDDATALLGPMASHAAGIIVVRGPEPDWKPLSTWLFLLVDAGTDPGWLHTRVAPLLSLLEIAHRESDRARQRGYDAARALEDRRLLTHEYTLFRESLLKEIAQRREAEAESQSFARDLADANRALREAVERLRETDRRKTDFLAAVSHELRTPLAVTLGAVESLRKSAGDAACESTRRMSEIAVRNIQRLDRLIGNLLDIARIDMQAFRLNTVSIDLREPVKATLDNARILADRRGLRIEAHLPGFPIPAKVDPDRIIQVVSNLVDNSLRYARSRIHTALSNGCDSIELRVADDGPGIPLDEHPKLFQRFTPIVATHEKGHIGLGLFIVKTIVEAHGGSVRAENSVEKDFTTSFIVSLPRSEG